LFSEIALKRLLPRSTLPALLAAALLAGCASGPRLDSSYTAKSQDSRVLYLILHYTTIDTPTSLRVLTQEEVSSHYLVGDGPRPVIYRLVDENRRAWHAGPSEWKGHTALNASSIGIEIVNLGYKDTPQGRVWFDYPPEQIEVLMPLIRDIVKRHQIRPDRVLAHSDVQPQWKQDPGPRFPWKRLADEGLVLWPDAAKVAAAEPGLAAQLPDVAWFQARLARHGFKNGVLDEETRNVISAFQMKYRPDRIDGTPDARTAALLVALTEP
jgi:N-acetylmuramoyl-L-alanine amidase